MNTNTSTALIIHREADSFGTITVEDFGNSRYVWTIEAGTADAAGFASSLDEAVDLACRRRHAMMCEHLVKVAA